MKMSKKQIKIGVFGGTFDPIHIGHLEIAKAAMAEAELDEVLFMVAGKPWQKIDQEISPARDRLELASVAIEYIEGFLVSDLEVKRKGESYTADTLKELTDFYEKENQPASLFFILGSDVMSQIETWKRLEEVKELATFIIVERPDFKLSEDFFKQNDFNLKYLTVEGPYLDISATDIRERIKNNQDIEAFLPEPVIKIIKERKLYG